MDKIRLGVEWNPRTGAAGKRVEYDLASHITLIAPTGAGKGVGLELPNLLAGMREMSVLSIDPSGQNAAVCAEARRKMGSETLMLNPFNLHAKLYPDLADIGCNPLQTLNPHLPSFFEDAMALGDAAISTEGESQIHFPNSARGLLTWLMIFTRLQEGEKAHLGTVRDLLTGDLCAVAEEAVSMGYERLSSLAYKYRGKTKELESVISTAETQTRWLLSDQMRASLAKNGIGDFGRLKDRPSSLFLILPAGTELENHAVWLRMIVTCALNALYRRTGESGTPVIFMLSEFAQLGKVAPIRAAFGQARKYGIRLWPVLQDMNQLLDLYGRHGAGSFIANSGCVIGMTPGDPDTAEWMSNFSGREGVLSMNASDDLKEGVPRLNFGAADQRVWSSDKIRELPEFHGLVWKAGSSRPQPVYLEPYWDDSECVRVARPDPFHLHDTRSAGIPLCVRNNSPSRFAYSWLSRVAKWWLAPIAQKPPKSRLRKTVESMVTFIAVVALLSYGAISISDRTESVDKRAALGRGLWEIRSGWLTIEKTYWLPDDPKEAAEVIAAYNAHHPMFSPAATPPPGPTPPAKRKNHPAQ